MAEAPKRAGPSLVTTANTGQAIYTAPGASTWGILREIDVANELSYAVMVSIGIGTAATDAAGKRIIASVSVQPNDSWSWSGFLPLFGHATTPDLLYVACSVANAVTVTVGVVEGP